MASPNDPNTTPRHASQTMSAEMFANLGTPDMAYIRPIIIASEGGDAEAWGVFSANGQQLGWAPARDLAFAAAMQNELVPVSVH